MTHRLAALYAAIAGVSLALGAGGGLTASRKPSAVAGSSKPATNAIEIVADIVLIEAQCRQIIVDYGRLFAFAQRNGIAPDDLMPVGERRAAFDEVYRQRARELGHEPLCTGVLAAREADVPGVFSPR